MSDATDAYTSDRATKSWTLDVVLLGLLTAALGFLCFQSSPIFDELYHVLAARSWVQDGSLAIANGSYTRAKLFTEVLGELFGVLGDESLQTAKILPLIGAVLLTIAMYCWVRAVFGRAAALCAVLLFVLSPGALYISQFVRFYSWHALAVWVFVTCFYSGLVGGHGPFVRGLLALLGVVAWAIALHLQPTTMIATAGFGLWVFVMWGPSLLVWIARLPRGGWILLGLALLVILLVLGTLYVGLLAKVWALLRHASPWQDDVRDDILYYHTYFLHNFPAFWALLPLAWLLATRRNLAAGLLCMSVVVVAVVLHSLGAAKNYRYIHYIMPFFFVLWGVTLVEVVPAIYRAVERAATAYGARIPTQRDLRKPLTFCTLALTVLFLLVANSAYIDSALLLLRGDPRVHWSVQGWQAAAERFRPLIEESDVVATSNGLFALYFLGRYDIDISPSQVAESASGEEFGQDIRTGAYAISTPESMAKVMACFGSGFFISDSLWRWRDPDVGVSDEMAAFLETHAEEIDLPKDWMLRAYRWQRPEEAPPPESCPNLPGLGSGKAATGVGQD